MYDIDGNHRFSIYLSDNALPISGFDYDKLNIFEIQPLVLLDSFWVMKIEDLLQMINDPEQTFNFVGNRIYVYLSL